MSKKQALQLFVGLLVTVACLAWAVKDVNWQDVRVAFAEANYATIPVYLLFLGLFYGLKAVRWSWLLQPVQRIPTRRIAGPMMVGFMGNNILPAHLGELFRVILLGRQEGVRFGAVLSSVAVERMLDIFAVLCLMGIGLVGAREVPTALQQAFTTIGGAALLGVIGLIAGLIWIDHAVRLGQAVVDRLPLPVSVRKHARELIASAAEGTVALKQGKLLLLLLSNSLIQWSCNCVMIYLSLWSFGIQVTFDAPLVLLGALAFAVTIPSTPGFFGLIQAAFVQTLALYGVAESTAFAASIYYHLLQYVVVTGVGLICLWQSGSSLTRLQHAAEELETDEPGPGPSSSTLES